MKKTEKEQKMIGNEEFHSMTSSTTPFIETLTKLTVEYFGLESEAVQERLRSSPLGKYLTKVQDCVWEIDDTVQDIEMIRDLLLDYAPWNPLGNDKNSGKLIRYHYENLILRVPKIKDLLLLLVNQVLALELPRKMSLETKLLKLVIVDHPNFEMIWEHVTSATAELKPYRNHLAHNGTMKHKDIAMLGALHSYGHLLDDVKEEDKIRIGNLLISLQHELVEKFASHAEIHLKNIELQLKMVYLFLGSPFAKKLGELYQSNNKKTV
jgi:hypothetical protein